METTVISLHSCSKLSKKVDGIYCLGLAKGDGSEGPSLPRPLNEKQARIVLKELDKPNEYIDEFMKQECMLLEIVPTNTCEQILIHLDGK